MLAVSGATEAELRERLLTGQPLDLGSYWSLLQRQFPELAALAAVSEEARDVRPRQSALEHTQRVLAQVQPRLGELAPAQAQALYLGALLHEIGRGVPRARPGATPRRGRTAAALARDVLFRLRIPPLLRDQVVYLVRWHGVPFAAPKRPPSPGRMLQVAWTLDTQLLYLLARADCEVAGQGEEQRRCQAVRAFRQRYEAAGLFGREPPPIVPPRRWERLAPADPRLRRRVAGELRFWRVKGRLNTPEQAVAWLEGQSPALAGTLYLPVGVPGSGKSTWIGRHLEGARLVSMDELRERLLGWRGDQSRNQEIYRRARGMLARALRDGETVVWDAQSHTWGARQGLLALARESHAYVAMVFLDVPLGVALERNAGRRDAVPEEVIVRSYGALEEPRPFEAEEIWRVDADGNTTRYVWGEAAGDGGGL